MTIIIGQVLSRFGWKLIGEAARGVNDALRGGDGARPTGALFGACRVALSANAGPSA
jgi:hypothetical protein